MTEEKLYQEIRKDLYEKYNTGIAPKIKDFEKFRRKTYKPNIIALFFAIPIVFIIISVIALTLTQRFPFFKIDSVFFTILLFLAFFGLIIVCFISSYPVRNFQHELKSVVMPIFCSCFSNLKWAPNREHSTRLYVSSGVISQSNNVKYDDCFEGKYKDIDFIIEEIETTSFCGVLIQFRRINKKFKGHTIIYPSYMGKLSFENMHYTEFEDVIFERKYNVFTNDDVEARYLITPTLMERLNNIKVSFNAQFIYSAFYKGMFIVGIRTCDNLFDYGQISNSLSDPKPFIKMAEEFISILKLIDHFKLDQKIGM